MSSEKKVQIVLIFEKSFDYDYFGRIDLMFPHVEIIVIPSNNIQLLKTKFSDFDFRKNVCISLKSAVFNNSVVTDEEIGLEEFITKHSKFPLEEYGRYIFLYADSENIANKICSFLKQPCEYYNDKWNHLEGYDMVAEVYLMHYFTRLLMKGF